MNLPRYFLADLPQDGGLSPAMISEACQTLRRNREAYLSSRSTKSVISMLSGLAKDWRSDNYPYRQLALQLGPAAHGFSAKTIAKGLDTFFGQVTEGTLASLISEELGHPGRLDELVSTPAEEQAGRSAMARGYELLGHVTAGNIPVAGVSSIILGFLVRSAQVVKCATGSSLIPRLFAHSLYELEPKLASCLEIVEWPGGSAELEHAFFEQIDCLTASGSDESIEAIKRRLPSHVRFIGYGHRVSFGYIARELLSSFSIKTVVASAARDVIAWNQLGCLSPHLFYLEQRGELPGEEFAEQLAFALEAAEAEDPRGSISIDLAANISARRTFYLVRAAHSPATRQWNSRNSTAWTVVYEADPLFQVSCLNRFIYVKSVRTLEDALRAADRIRDQVSTVALAAGEERLPQLAAQLAHWGVPRVCPLGKMQDPPLGWRHDGRPVLGDLVTWTDWER